MSDLKEFSSDDLKKELEKREKIKITPPEILQEFNFYNIKKICQDYIIYCASDDFHEDNDWKQYIYERALETFYGKDIWKWLNSRFNQSP